MRHKREKRLISSGCLTFKTSFIKILLREFSYIHLLGFPSNILNLKNDNTFNIHHTFIKYTLSVLLTVPFPFGGGTAEVKERRFYRNVADSFRKRHYTNLPED